jgi:hypothetical protein
VNAGQFKKGQPSANPGGEPKEKPMRDALRIVLAEEVEIEGERKKKLRVIMEALANRAMVGDVGAIREVLERIDGKIAQPQQHSGADGKGPIIVQIVYPSKDE